MKPRFFLLSLFRRWWKCQSATLDEQYAAGVRVFDFRVCLVSGRWRFAHGLATLRFPEKPKGFGSLQELVDRVSEKYPDAMFRLVLERGGKKAVRRFKDEAAGLSLEEKCNLWTVDVKSEKTWNGAVLNRAAVLAERGYGFAKHKTWEAPNRELHGYIDFGNWDDIDLRKEAERINSAVDFSEAKSRKDALWLLDYCVGNYE